jgi:hypothetical protein
VRRHIKMLNAMVNMAFKHLDMDRLSPFRRLYISGEGELSRTMAPRPSPWSTCIRSKRTCSATRYRRAWRR